MLTDAECVGLRRRICDITGFTGTAEVVDVWRSFPLSGVQLTISEENDRSGVGAHVELLDGDGMRSEAEDVHPGIAACRFQFWPVGTCFTGSGDPYFVHLPSGIWSPVWRIHHEAGEDLFYGARDFAMVSVSLVEFLGRVEVER